MSALKPRRESPPELVAAARSKPLEFEAWKKFMANQPTREERTKAHSGSGGAKTLPDDHHTRKVRAVHTPGGWKQIGIEQDGTRFRLLMIYSRAAITAEMLRAAGCEADTATAGLRLGEAVASGAALDAKFTKLLAR